MVFGLCVFLRYTQYTERERYIQLHVQLQIERETDRST